MYQPDRSYPQLAYPSGFWPGIVSMVVEALSLWLARRKKKRNQEEEELIILAAALLE